VPAQIAVLLALSAQLFDRVPLEQMTDAEHALRDASAKIPADVAKRLETADTLSDADRNTIVELARNALARFQPKPESKPDAKPPSTPAPKSTPPIQRHPNAAPEPTPKDKP
jgi:F-type H+-transporting ATPase subunit alpha